jgi:hypothetical protein
MRFIVSSFPDPVAWWVDGLIDSDSTILLDSLHYFLIPEWPWSIYKPFYYQFLNLYLSLFLFIFEHFNQITLQFDKCLILLNLIPGLVNNDLSRIDQGKMTVNTDTPLISSFFYSWPYKLCCKKRFPHQSPWSFVILHYIKLFKD